MPTQLFRTARATFRADFVKLPMSGSYHTLFRRIEAMKHVQKISRGRFILLCSALAMAGALAIVPWRVVAQDAKAPAGAAAAQNDPNAAAPAKSDSVPKPSTALDDKATTPADKSAAEKLIGAWRAGLMSGKLTFNADGTLTEFPNTLSQPLFDCTGFELAESPSTFKGTWRVRDGVVEVNWTCMVRPTTGPALNAEPSPVLVSKEFTTKLRISRLDPTFLRLTYSLGPEGENSYTLFFRRLGSFKLDTLKGKVPDEVLEVAEHAGMDSQEAEALYKWAKSDASFSERLKLVARVAQAKSGKLTFAQVAKLTPEEDKAYSDLKKLMPWLPQVIGLADQGMLEEKEQEAMRRIQSLVKEFGLFAYAVTAPNAPKYIVGSFGSSIPDVGSPLSGSKTEVEHEAAMKLTTFTEELADWLFKSEHAPLLGGDQVLPNGAGQGGGGVIGGGGGF